MPEQVTRDEHRLLEARVSVVEAEVEGEKMVTRHILEQTRRNGDDLATIKKRLDGHDRRFDAHDRRFDQLDGKFDALIKNLPAMIAEVMRDVLRERDRER